MEIVLQWLDDLDDLAFAIIASWRSICRTGLAPGLSAAVILTPVYSAELGLISLALLTAIAAGSVLAWTLAAAITLRRTSSELAISA